MRETRIKWAINGKTTEKRFHDDAQSETQSLVQKLFRSRPFQLNKSEWRPVTWADRALNLVRTSDGQPKEKKKEAEHDLIVFDAPAGLDSEEALYCQAILLGNRPQFPRKKSPRIVLPVFERPNHLQFLKRVCRWTQANSWDLLILYRSNSLFSAHTRMPSIVTETYIDPFMVPWYPENERIQEVDQMTNARKQLQAEGFFPRFKRQSQESSFLKCIQKTLGVSHNTWVVIDPEALDLFFNRRLVRKLAKSTFNTVLCIQNDQTILFESESMPGGVTMPSPIVA